MCEVRLLFFIAFHLLCYQRRGAGPQQRYTNQPTNFSKGQREKREVQNTKMMAGRSECSCLSEKVLFLFYLQNPFKLRAKRGEFYCHCHCHSHSHCCCYSGCVEFVFSSGWLLLLLLLLLVSTTMMVQMSRNQC